MKDIGGFLQQIDGFGEPLPTFNIRGQEKVNSMVGGVATLLIICLVAAFGGLKLEQLLKHRNPNLSTYAKDVQTGSTMNLNDRKFRVAFAVEPYYAPHFLLNDPAYVKWYFRKWGKKDGVSYEKLLQPHICTDEDYAEFFTISEQSAIFLKEIREDPRRDFYCIDWDDEDPIEIWGAETDAN